MLGETSRKMDIASITPSPDDGELGETSRQKPTSILKNTQPHSPASTPAPNHVLPESVFGSSEGFARKRKCYSDDEEDDKENSESEFGREKRKRHHFETTAPPSSSRSSFFEKAKEDSSGHSLKEVQTEQQVAFEVPSTEFEYRQTLSGSTTPIDRPSTPTRDFLYCDEESAETYLTNLALEEPGTADDDIQPIKTPVLQTPTQSPFNSPSRRVGIDDAQQFLLTNRLSALMVNPEFELDDNPPPSLPAIYLPTWPEFTEVRAKKYGKEAHLMKHRESNYLNNHPALNKPIRWMVVNWMHQVAHEHRLKRQTFHIAVNLLDIMLSKEKNFQRDVHFQLLGVVALLFASKMEEEQPPLIETLCEFVSDEEDIDYERNMRQARAFVFQKEFKLLELVHVYAPQFFERDPTMPVWPTQNLDTIRIATSRFVAASTALADAVADYESIKFKNSILAAATFHLAYCRALPERPFKLITGYDIDSIQMAISFMEGHYQYHNPDLNAIFPKYDHQEKYDVISHLSLPSKTLEEMEIHWQKRDKGEIDVTPVNM